MIYPHELRIGSWVLVEKLILNDRYFSGKPDHTKGPIEVESIWAGGINLQRSYDGGIKEMYDWRNIHPIPLTPEILEKCGFEKHVTSGIASLDDEEKYGDTYYFEKHIKESEVCDSFDFTLVKWGDSELTFSSHWLRVRIKSLHQLQNLYFALTRTELNYSPDNKIIL